MSDFYARMAETSLRLIADKGTDCTVAGGNTSGGYDEETGRPLDDIEPLVQSAKCVVLNYSDALRNVTDTLIETGDKKILIAAKGVTTPALSDTIAITATGKVYTVMEVKDIKPAETALIYEVRGRE